jgi:hypothetical protein
MFETFKEIDGFGGKYLVSDQGRIFSNHKKTRGFLRLIRKRDGYLAVNLCGPSGRKMLAVHRLVLDAFAGPAPEGTEASHLDGDRANNAISNLRYEKHSENCQRRRAHGTQATNRTNCKIGHLVPYIREMIGDGLRNCEIARHLKIDPATVSRIKNGRSWTHV